jgi:hypothetical protein
MLAEDELLDAKLLVFANKADLPNAMSVAQVTEALQLHKLRQRQWYIQSCCAPTGDGLIEGLDWLANAIYPGKLKGSPIATLDGPKTSSIATSSIFPVAANIAAATTTTTTTSSDGKSKGDSKSSPAVETKSATASSGDDEKDAIPLYLQWIMMVDGTDQEFIDGLNACTLTSWNHRSLLRLCWLYLTIEGRRNGIKKIFSGIQHFLNTAPAEITRAGPQFHETTLYFWVHLVHYNIEVSRNPSGDFKGFLFMGPPLCNDTLINDYYSKKLLASDTARTSVVLPDRKPLPSMVPKGSGRDRPVVHR